MASKHRGVLSPQRETKLCGLKGKNGAGDHCGKQDDKHASLSYVLCTLKNVCVRLGNVADR